MSFAQQRILAAGILAVAKDTGRILLGRRSLNDFDVHKGEYCIFGGKMEANELPKQTAIREFVEESGYGHTVSTKGKKFLLTKKPFYISDTNHTKFFTYLAIFNEEFTPDLFHQGTMENINFAWVRMENMPEALHSEFKKMIDEKYDEIQRYIDYFS